MRVSGLRNLKYWTKEYSYVRGKKIERAVYDHYRIKHNCDGSYYAALHIEGVIHMGLGSHDSPEQAALECAYYEACNQIREGRMYGNMEKLIEFFIEEGHDAS